MGIEIDNFLLDRLLKERGITTKSLAESLGCAYGYVSKVRGGSQQPGKKLLGQIADFLEVAEEDLLKHEGVSAFGGQELSPAEVRLVAAYRSMNGVQQRMCLVQAESVVIDNSRQPLPEAVQKSKEMLAAIDAVNAEARRREQEKQTGKKSG
jgi:DNA-binding Xre family transcriptional regulator